MAPSHASVSRKRGGEALTGGVQAWLLSSEITSSGLPTLWSEGEGHTICRVSARGVSNPRSQRPSAFPGLGLVRTRARLEYLNENYGCFLCVEGIWPGPTPNSNLNLFSGPLGQDNYPSSLRWCRMTSNWPALPRY
jgi:hypothetical protein